MITLKNLKIYAEDGIIENGYIQFDEIIQYIGQGDIEGIDMKGYLLIPGFIDQHIHGLSGYDVMDGTIESMEKIVSKLPLEGTTSFLATTMTETKEETKKVLMNLSEFHKNQTPGNSELIGIHLEGPFISEEYKGAQRSDVIQEVSIDLFDEIFNASSGLIKQVTLAPELEKSQELIRYMSLKGVVPSIGHTNASSKVTLDAIRNGARCFTHAYNAMSKLHHRDIGAVGAMLLSEDSFAEVICDKVHVSDEAIKLLYKLKGSEKTILVTDSMRAKLEGDGEFELGGQSVTVKNGVARLHDGSLAGSTLLMNEAIRNFIDITGANIQDIIKMSSENPAKLHGLFDRKGSIKVGKDADLLVVDNRLNIVSSYCKGK